MMTAAKEGERSSAGRAAGRVSKAIEKTKWEAETEGIKAVREPQGQLTGPQRQLRRQL